MNTIKQQLLQAIDIMRENGFDQEAAYIEQYTKQFVYRYLPLFGHWKEDERKWMQYAENEVSPELDYIDEALYDGTYNKQRDDKLLSYHKAGKPMKLAMKCHVNKTYYTAYFWMDDDSFRTIFNQFYGVHPDTETDFIIHIDLIANHYQLALYHHGLKESVPIPEEAYQLIVFKNNFEYFRSENYDQPRGAWIW